MERITKVREGLTAAAIASGIPGHMREGIVEYIITGRPVGTFLFRVIANDFLGAYTHADMINRICLHSFAEFLNLHAPDDSYGSEEAYEKWLQRKGLLPSLSPTPEPERSAP